MKKIISVVVRFEGDSPDCSIEDGKMTFVGTSDEWSPFSQIQRVIEAHNLSCEPEESDE